MDGIIKYFFQNKEHMIVLANEPIDNCLKVMVNNQTKFIHLVDVMDENASHLRIYMNGKVFALAEK